MPQLPGDFNADGTVDASDYVVWRKGLGTTFVPADYNAWRSHFGQTLAIANAATVPEPTAWILWGASWTMLITARCPIVTLALRSARR